MSAYDAQKRFHEVWLGLAQPIEGLVFTVPVLADAQIAPSATAALSERFRECCEATDETPRVANLWSFFESFLGYSRPGMLVPRNSLPDSLSFYAAEGGQEIRPSFAIARHPQSLEDDPFAGLLDEPEVAPASDAEETLPVALVWDVRDDAGDAGDDLPLDRAEDVTGPWRYPPSAKLERLLRHSGVPIGLLSNGRALRLLYAPAGESTSHMTFRFADLADTAGRPLLAAFELLLGAARCYSAAPEHTLEGLLAESRRRQADVTHELANQVFEAVEILLEGYEQAWRRDAATQRANWLSAALEAPDDHFYEGVLSVVLRLVFLLYAEDKGLLPNSHPFYSRHLSLQGLHDELLEDSGLHPDSMHHRFGAYGRLLALFRAVYLGVQHGDLFLPPRRGRLFDPSSFPFLEGGLPGSTAAIVSATDRAQVRPPRVDDGVIHEVLSRLVIFQGQRLSYSTLDVEQIGSVYESLMGFHVLRVASPAVRLGKPRYWVETEELRRRTTRERKTWLKETAKLSAAQLKRVEEAVEEHGDEDALATALLELAPGRRAQRQRHRAVIGQLVLQPGEERRRSGSHYTPRSLTEPIVRRTLEPLLACLGDNPTEEQILSLKICDPAMGSGAFLVEVCRQLADALVAVWSREGRDAAIAEAHGDPHLHARRLVAQRCLYGVDKNAAAVELAKLSLWIVTLAADLPFTFVDHALRHGDSLVGLDLEQITAFHWQPKKQQGLFEKELRDALEQAIRHRQELLALAHRDDAASQQEKRRLLDHAEWATARIRLVADVCVGAFFTGSKTREREQERQRRLDLVSRYMAGETEPEAELRDLAEQIRDQHAPLHWWLEFPEVFYEERPGPLADGEVTGATLMEGFVGNPPFLGGRRISVSLGRQYNSWLAESTNPGASTNADLSAHFFYRAAALCGAHGTLGLIATNTISEGDTRTAGLEKLLATGYSIYEAESSMPWPGMATVTVSLLHLAKGCPTANTGHVILNGETASIVNSRLQPEPERPNPQNLRKSKGHAFQGYILLGKGFILNTNDRDILIDKDSSNSEIIEPYIGGDEVNTYPDQSYVRHVINFKNLSKEQAQNWPSLLEVVREKVRPVRRHQKRAHLREKWWQFAETRPALTRKLASIQRCLVASRHQPHLVVAFQPTGRVFSEALCVFPLETNTAFAVLQSRIHEYWARLLSSSLEDRLRYTASKCFDTFPFPKPDPRTVLPDVEAIGQTLYETRAAFMIATDQGLTKTYNALKDPENHDPAILELRQLHEAMDRAVLDAYGWGNVEVPPFCPLDDADREKLQAFEDEVIDRLYVLNAERAREEKRLGLGKGEKGSKKAKTPRRKTEDPNQGSLFGGKSA